MRPSYNSLCGGAHTELRKFCPELSSPIPMVDIAMVDISNLSSAKNSSGVLRLAAISPSLHHHPFYNIWMDKDFPTGMLPSFEFSIIYAKFFLYLTCATYCHGCTHHETCNSELQGTLLCCHWAPEHVNEGFFECAKMQMVSRITVRQTAWAATLYTLIWE